MQFRHFFAELKRRHVFRVAVVYAVVAWVVIQVASDIFPALNLPAWTVTLVVILSFLGFPIALVLGWAFDITPDGVERTESQTPSPPAQHESRQPNATTSAASRFTSRTRHMPGVSRRESPTRQGGAPRPAAESAAPTTEAQPPDPARVKRASLAYLRHELRTPINAIIGYSEMLIEDTAAPEQKELRADLQKIHDAGKQVLSIVDDILHPDRISASAGRPEQDLDAFRVQLQYALRTPLNAVVGYSEMLIERGKEADQQDLLSDLQRILDAAKLVVDKLNDIVQFSAADIAAIEQNTSLSAASVMAQEALANIQPLSADAVPDVEVHDGCLLVVDDNATNRDLLSRQLARGGYSVRTAKNGREALEMIRTQDFDLVLLDIMMPEVNGFEVLRQLKSDEALRDIPVIMISALDEIDSVVRCIEMGAEDYLSKPFDPVLLKARIGANLETRHLRDRAHAYAEQLRIEQDLSDRLLLSTFPSLIAERLRRGEAKIADVYPEATALWAEFDGSGRTAARNGPAEFMDRLVEIFAAFDRAAEKLGLETIGITGHTCIIAGGVPTPRDDHADAIALMALEMVQETARHAAESHEPLQIRIGMHTGPVIAGVIDTGKLTYGLCGDAVDSARRLSTHCTPGSILVSPATYLRLRDTYQFHNRGVIEVTGKGQMRTYVLQGKTEPSYSPS